jgi:hypothetical protein
LNKTGKVFPSKPNQLSSLRLHRDSSHQHQNRLERQNRARHA